MIRTDFFKFKRPFSGLLILFSVFFLISACQTSPENKKDNILAGKSPDKEQYLEWFKEAKFGLFIHWGVYAELAGEWNGRKLSDVGKTQGEWVMNYLQIPVKEYREIAHKFNPVKFNALEWVRLVKATGMKYIVITAKHHDGFAMYHSSVTKYNIVDWTPFGRDPLKELADACKQEGIKFCVYYSHREDWDHPGAYGNSWDFDNEWGWDFYPKEKFNKYLEEKAKPQLRELLTNYGPIGLVWFDRGMYTQEQGLEFVNLVHDLQPACLTNSRVGSISLENVGDYQSMGDNAVPPGGLQEYWETCMTLNDTWGYNKYDSNWKTPETVIRRLAEIVSRGGNYLLNIGPTGAGEIPQATIDIFKKVGPWVERNAESIYGTTASVFGELPWGYSSVKGSCIYLFVRDWPQDGVLTLSGLKNKAISAKILIDKSIDLSFSQTEGKTTINLSKNPADNPITVIELKLEGIPVIDPPVVAIDTKGILELNYLTAITHGKAKTRYNRTGGPHIGKWTGPDDYAEWHIHLDKPGIFSVNISYAADKEWEGKQYEITNGFSKIKTTVIHTGTQHVYHEFPVGYFEFEKPGDYTLTIKPTISGDTNLMYLRHIKLKSVSVRKTEGWGVN
jgi:alpha-L-fucosidase